MRNWNSYRLPGDPNLPGGCTNADIDRAMGGDEGEEDCENCNEGLLDHSECCGEAIKDGKCEKCGEEANREQCPECEGKGYITFSISERRAEARERAAEDRWEEQRLERRGW